jgi:hypothetical protein
VSSDHWIEPSCSAYPPDRNPLGTAGQLFAEILGEEMAEPGPPVATEDHRAAPSRSCEPKELVGDCTVSDWTTESYVQGARGQARRTKGLGRLVDDASGLALVLGDPLPPFGMEGCREPVLRPGIPRATVLQESGRNLGKDVGDTHTKSSTATQHASYVCDGTLRFRRLVENEEETSLARP